MPESSDGEPSRLGRVIALTKHLNTHTQISYPNKIKHLDTNVCKQKAKTLAAGIDRAQQLVLSSIGHLHIICALYMFYFLRESYMIKDVWSY